MVTRAKNKTTHPAACVMSPAQLAAAGIPAPPLKRSQKKPTKDERIAALEEDLRATRELLLQTVFTSRSPWSIYSTYSFSQSHVAGLNGSVGMTPESPSDCGDTELATDDDDDYSLPTGSRKRSSQKSAPGSVRYVD